MFKFLRKYSTWLLAIFGSFLMIAFLVPQAIQNLAGQAASGGATMAYVADEEITSAEWEQYDAQLKILEQFGLGLPGLGLIDKTEHWMLLVREAQSMGLVGEMSREDMDPQLMAFASSMGVTPDLFRQTMSNYDGVSRMIALYFSAGVLSDRRLENVARRLLQKVDAEMVILQADADAVDYEPTEEEIQAQYEQYRDVAPGEGEMGFGYRLPDRVKLEWLAITAADARGLVDDESIDPVALRKYWIENQGQGRIPAYERGAPTPDMVQMRYVGDQVQAKLDEIARAGTEALRAPQRALPTRNGRLDLPEDWPSQRADLEALGESLREQFGIPLPTYRTTGEWMRPDELTSLEEVGGAITMKFGTPRNLRQLVEAMPELGGTGALPVQEGVALPPLRTENHSVYFVRVLEAEDSHAPESLDVVREQVVADLKRQAHFEALRAEAESIEQAAEAQGLVTLAIEREAPLETARQMSLFDPMQLQIAQLTGQAAQVVPTRLPVIGVSEAASEAIIDYALQFDKMTVMSDLPVEEQIFTVPVEDALALLVVRLTGQTPLTQDELDRMVQQNTLQAILIDEEYTTGDGLLADFSLDALAARHDLEVVANLNRDDPALQDDAGDDAATGDV